MSEKKRLSPKESLPYIVAKIGLSNFESLATDLLESRKDGKAVFEVSISRSISGIEDDTITNLSQKYNVAKEEVNNALSALHYLFKQLLTNKRDSLIEKLKQVENIGDKANSIVEIGERLDKKFPDIRERFYVTTFCKTTYYGDIDWEIVYKVIEHPTYHFEKKERFPVCVIRLILEKPMSVVRPLYPQIRKNEFVFEVSPSDIDHIIATLSSIKEKMEEAKREIAMEVQ